MKSTDKEHRSIHKPSYAEQKLSEAKERIVLYDKYFEEGDLCKAKEYLLLAANASQEAFDIASQNIADILDQVDNSATTR